MTVTKNPAPLGAIIGAGVAAVAMYVYLNTATIEVLAARADGFSLWSWEQVPFVIPEAIVGGLVGAGIGKLVRVARRRAARVTTRVVETFVSL